MDYWRASGLCPGILTKLFDKENKENVDDTEANNVRKLTKPLTYSALILIIVLLTGLIAPILQQVPFFTQRKETMRSLSFILLGELTLFQLWAVLLTLAPNDLLERFINRVRKKKEILTNMQSLTQKR